ncbi:uncharacterized protein PHACADRAFT_194601 [Phanerochaete carnosa HHB-10118-sp]|uniref:Uncharacterized protein n=1 Tax=Phanerochaete carnosa (strain HHB-10118-sp) TaxID=650164 RepID=K5V380_PHACS|nr:uncharacterized protein PHACADRAFT_194601 [Phanerochaete carnosa HHB-10118-sp]EKM57026.1 hypothetical protein PHACADRAFT_194601 [Phanerochaete carnosa HHB-10118-sp]
MSLADYAVALMVVATSSLLSLAVINQAFAEIVHLRSNWERRDAICDGQPASPSDPQLDDPQHNDPQDNDPRLGDLPAAGPSEPQLVGDLQSARPSDSQPSNAHFSDLPPARSSDPHPSDPQPSDPQPRDPQPSDPHSSDPHSGDPYPISPQSVDPQPASTSDHDLQLVKPSGPRSVRDIVGHSSYTDSQHLP